MSRARKDLGERGETAALDYLRAKGYDLIERNHRQRSGEVDLILRHGDTLVFCEVKTSLLGNACESYSLKQQRRVRGLALAYLARSGWQGPIRVDLIAFDRAFESPHFEVHHFEDAVAFQDNWG